MNDEVILHSIEAGGLLYFIQARFTDDYSCEVTITDSVNSWKCNVKKSEIETFAEETESDLKEYYNLMKSALSGLPVTQSFHCSIDDTSSNKINFEWKRVQNDVKFSLGTLTLHKVADSKSAMRDILLSCSKSLKCLKNSLESSQLVNENLQKDNQLLLDNLEKCSKLKEDLENELLAKFVLVVNEKKAKIRSLQKQLSETPVTSDTVRKNDDGSKPLASNDAELPTCSDNLCASKSEKLELGDSLDGDSIFPKRKRVRKKQPLTISMSPVKTKEIHPISPVKFPSDFNATSSDSTVDVNELLEEL